MIGARYEAYIPRTDIDKMALNAVLFPRYIRPRSISTTVTATIERTGTCVVGLMCAKYFGYGVAESRANAQYVREVEVQPAALAATAIEQTINIKIVAPALLFVTFWYSCMKGNPVGDVSTGVITVNNLSYSRCFGRRNWFHWSIYGYQMRGEISYIRPSHQENTAA